MAGITCASVPVLLLLQISGVYSGSYCTYSYSTQYCNYGCCYTGADEPCCSSSNSYYTSLFGTTANTVLSVGTIVGIVIGALVGLAVIIGIIIAIVSCCCKTTRVVNPQPVTYTGHTMTVFQTNTSGAGPSTGNLPGQPQQLYYGYGQGPQGPPPYSQKGMGSHPPPYIPQGQPPPPYPYSNPAYPPPSTAPSVPPASTAGHGPPPTPSPFAAAVNSAGN